MILVETPIGTITTGCSIVDITIGRMIDDLLEMARATIDMRQMVIGKTAIKR